MALPALQEREAIVLGELKRRGYGAPQIAAIMGSARQESAFNPWANEAGGTGLGLFQWSYGRRAKVPKATGDYATDVARQIDLFESELAGSEKKAGSMLKSAGDLSSAAAAMKEFERYGVPGKRYDYMRLYADRLNTGQIQPISPAASAAAGDGAGALEGSTAPAAALSAPAAKALNPIAAAALAGHNASSGLDDLAALRNGRLPDDPQRMVGAALAEALLPDQTPAANSQLGDELVNLLATGSKAAPAVAAAGAGAVGATRGGLGIVDIGKRLQAMGFKVAEHPEFGGVGTHSPRSHHYVGNAVDLTIQPGSPLLKGRKDSDWKALTAQFGSQLKAALPDAEIFHPGNEPKGHGTHIHLALPKGRTGVTPQLAQLLGIG